MLKRNRSRDANRTRFALRFPHPFWIAILSVCIGGSATQAVAITYTVDPARSRLTLSGTWGSQIMAQINGIPPGTDTLTTSYNGTMTVDRDATLGTLRISGGSVAALDGGYYAPSGGTANYGVKPFLSRADGAFRRLAFSLSSSLITAPSSFDASKVAATLISGQFDYATYSDTTPIVVNEFSMPLTGVLSLAPGSASLTDIGSTETLVIPVEADLLFLANDQPFVGHFSGSWVATASVPEPASVVGLAAALSAILLRRRGRVH